MTTDAATTTTPGTVLTPGARPAPDIPGWHQAPCLGCGGLLKEARPPWITITGTRDGIHLLTYPAGPERLKSTFDPLATEHTLFLLGVAHLHCREKAHQRLLKGEVTLAADLPVVSIEPAPEMRGRRRLSHTDRSLCPFCSSSGDMTNEDIIPQWAQKALESLWSSDRGEYGHSWKQFLFPVCGSCNNRWMSTLENDASQIMKPMLTAVSASLTLQERTTLAAWATKVAFLLDCWSSTPTIPHEQVQWLGIYREPPPTVSVWIGAHRSELLFAAQTSRVYLPASDGTSPAGVRVFFTLGNLVFIVRVKFAGDGFDGSFPPFLEDALIQLWPPVPNKDDADWPANRIALPVCAVGYLANALTTTPTSDVGGARYRHST